MASVLADAVAAVGGPTGRPCNNGVCSGRRCARFAASNVRQLRCLSVGASGRFGGKQCTFFNVGEPMLGCQTIISLR